MRFWFNNDQVNPSRYAGCVRRGQSNVVMGSGNGDNVVYNIKNHLEKIAEWDCGCFDQLQGRMWGAGQMKVNQSASVIEL